MTYGIYCVELLQFYAKNTLIIDQQLPPWNQGFPNPGFCFLHLPSSFLFGKTCAQVMKTRPCTKKQSPSQRVLPMEVFWVEILHPGNPMGLVESWAPKWNDHIGDTPHVETKKHEKMRGSGIYFWKSWSLKKSIVPPLLILVVDLIHRVQEVYLDSNNEHLWQWWVICHEYFIAFGLKLVEHFPRNLFWCWKVEAGRFMPPPVLQSGLLGLVVMRNPQDGTGVPSSRDRLQKQFWITLGIACH